MPSVGHLATSGDILIFKLIDYFWPLWVFVAEHRLSAVAEGRAPSLAAVLSLLIAVASLVEEHGLWALGLSGRWCTGSGAPQHVKSSWDGVRPVSPCIGRWIHKHGTTGGVLGTFQTDITTRRALLASCG